MMSDKSLFEEFKDMLFGHKVILVVLGFILYLVMTGIMVKDTPVDYFDYRNGKISTYDRTEKVREQFYGKSAEEIGEIYAKNTARILRYDSAEYDAVTKRLLEIKSKSVLLAFQARDNGGSSELSPAEQAEEKELEAKFYAMISEISKGISKEENNELSLYDGIYKQALKQIRMTGVNQFQDLRAENLFLGRGRFFGRDFNFMAWLNLLGLEIALALISYLYIRKNDGKRSARRIVSFSVIALLMALMIPVKQYVLTMMKYPSGIKNVQMAGIMYSGTRFTLFQFLGLMAVTWVIYYIARVIIYSKRAMNYDFVRSLLTFVILTGAMFFVYFNLNVGTFVALLGEGILVNITNHMIVLALLILSAGFSYRAYITGKPLIGRKKTADTEGTAEQG